MKKFFIVMIFMLFSTIYTNATTFEMNNNSNIEYVKCEVPAKILLYTSTDTDINITAFNKDLLNSIKYKFNGNTLNIWIENYTPSEIENIDFNDIEIRISSPNEVKIKTNENLSITSKKYKNRITDRYGKN